MPQKWLLFPFPVLLLPIFPSRPCFCRLCFDFGQNVKERWSNNQGNLFFIRFFFNVCANRMQSDESWLSKAMLRCSLTSPKAMSVQTECQTWKLVFESLAEVKPDFANAMSVQTECKTWKLVFESFAEVKPDFANAKIQHAQPEIHLFSPPDIEPRKFYTL